MNQIRVFLPAIRIFQALGLWPFSIDENYEPRTSRVLLYSCRLWVAITLFGLLTLIHEQRSFLSETKSDVGSTVDYIQLVGMRCSQVVILIEALWNERSLIRFFVSVSEIDKKMQTLGIDRNFTNQRAGFSAQLIAASTFYIGTSLLHLTILILRSEYGLILNYWMIYFLPYIVSCVRYFQVFNCIWFIKRRIESLNKKLEKIDMTSETVKRIQRPLHFKLYTTDNKFKSRPKPIKNFDQLILFREAYDKLYVLSTIVSYSFGLSLLVNIANDFVTLTVNSYFVFLRLQKLPHLERDDILRFLESVFWCLPHLMNVIVIAAVCHFTVQTVNLSFDTELTY